MRTAKKDLELLLSEAEIAKNEKHNDDDADNIKDVVHNFPPFAADKTFSLRLKQIRPQQLCQI